MHFRFLRAFKHNASHVRDGRGLPRHHRCGSVVTGIIDAVPLSPASYGDVFYQYLF